MLMVIRDLTCADPASCPPTGSIPPCDRRPPSLPLHAQAQRQPVLALPALHAGCDIEQVASARAGRDLHPAAVLARRCLPASRAGSTALARLPVPLTGCAFDRGRDPGEPEMLPD